MRARVFDNPAFNGYTIGFGAFAAFASLNAIFSFYGCPIKALTGYDCPGCGATRAVKSLFNGDIGAAVSSNAFILVLVPSLMLLYLVFAQRVFKNGATAKDPFSNRAFLYALTVLAIAWAIFRLTPWGEWFRP